MTLWTACELHDCMVSLKWDSLKNNIKLIVTNFLLREDQVISNENANDFMMLYGCTFNREDFFLQSLAYFLKGTEVLHLKHMVCWWRRCNGVQLIFCIKTIKCAPHLHMLGKKKVWNRKTDLCFSMLHAPNKDILIVT